MISVQRILPYTKQLVLYALYDVLDSEESDVLDSEESEYDKAENGGIAAKVTVYGNQSGFELSVSEELPATVLMVQISAPCQGLSVQGQRRAADYLADRVEQLLENELKLSVLLRTKGENIT